MRAELRDDKTLVIVPESTAELIVLQKFKSASVSIEKPKPFQSNVDLLRIEIGSSEKP